jgi:hypothetical protein
MRAILTNRLFQVGAATVLVVGLGYALYTPGDSSEETALDASSTETSAGAEEAIGTQESNTSTTNSEVTSESTETEAETTDNTTSE